MTSPPVVFDLDGTLIDSAPDLHACAARLLAGEGVAPLPLETIRRFVGNGVAKLVERIIAATGLDPADHERLTRAFLDAYTADPVVLTRLYPGVAAALDALARAGHPLGVCTNKPLAPTRHILDALGLAPRFISVIGGDGPLGRKPDPAGLRASFAALGGPGLFVGDSETDAETAVRADVPLALFTEGYRKAPIDEIPHAMAFGTFEELPGLVAAHPFALG